ncbi:hypothetical protein [Streptomyces spongiae]|nr:hypothetical protein [Streptomyces spongiae]
MTATNRLDDTARGERLMTATDPLGDTGRVRLDGLDTGGDAS